MTYQVTIPVGMPDEVSRGVAGSLLFCSRVSELITGVCSHCWVSVLVDEVSAAYGLLIVVACEKKNNFRKYIQQNKLKLADISPILYGDFGYELLASFLIRFKQNYSDVNYLSKSPE